MSLCLDFSVFVLMPESEEKEDGEEEKQQKEDHRDANHSLLVPCQSQETGNIMNEEL